MSVILAQSAIDACKQVIEKYLGKISENKDRYVINEEILTKEDFDLAVEKLVDNFKFICYKTAFPTLRYAKSVPEPEECLKEMRKALSWATYQDLGEVENTYDEVEPKAKITKCSIFLNIKQTKKYAKKLRKSMVKFIMQMCQFLDQLTTEEGPITKLSTFYTEALEELEDSVTCKPIFLDGFIMEGKTAYCEKTKGDAEFFEEHSAAWRETIEIAEEKTSLLKSANRLIGAFQFINFYLALFKKREKVCDVIIDRGPISVGVFNDCPEAICAFMAMLGYGGCSRFTLHNFYGLPSRAYIWPLRPGREFEEGFYESAAGINKFGFDYYKHYYYLGELFNLARAIDGVQTERPKDSLFLALFL